MRSLIVLTCCFFILTDIIEGQTPARLAYLGGWGKFPGSGMIIDSVAVNGSLQAAGLAINDTLISIGEIKTNAAADLVKAISQKREGDPLSIRFKRKNKVINKTVKALPKPFFTDDRMLVKYDWAAFGDGYLRTITYLPKNRTGKIPFILLVPGYNCGSIENYMRSYNGKIIRQWINAGYGVFTIEKSGIGDSYHCQPCEEVDLANDIDVFTLGYQKMKALNEADTGKLVIWGHSMGGVIAPVVANKVRPAGVIVFATVFRPWSEFLLEMHRVQAPLEGKSYEETELFVRKMQKIYYEFYVLKKTPEQLHNNPEYAATVESELDYKPGGTNQWGRHWRFWQQTDSLDLAYEWSQVNCPVLSIFGGADFIQCSALEHLLITQTVNKSHPDMATHITIPDIDHIMVTNKDWNSAFVNLKNPDYISKNYNPKIGEVTVDWLDKHIH